MESRAQLRAWLAAHHASEAGVWLVTYRKAAGDRHVPWPQIVQECLCWGWIDSLPRKLDDLRTMLWIAPRKPGSVWSAINKGHVAELLNRGLMTPAGQAVIDRAKADGSWFALDTVDALEVPQDLAAALAGRAGAAAAWDGFTASVRKAALQQLAAAKRSETRAARIATIVDCAARGERPFQWAPPGRNPPA